MGYAGSSVISNRQEFVLIILHDIFLRTQELKKINCFHFGFPVECKVIKCWAWILFMHVYIFVCMWVVVMTGEIV